MSKIFLKNCVTLKWKVQAKWQRHVTSSKFNLHSSFSEFIIVQSSKHTTRCLQQRTLWYEEKSTWHLVSESFRFHNFVLKTLTQLPLSLPDCTILTTLCLFRSFTHSLLKSITMRRCFRLLSSTSACLLLNKVERFVWKLLTGSTEAEHWGDMEAVIGLLLMLLGVSHGEMLNFLIWRSWWKLLYFIHTQMPYVEKIDWVMRQMVNLNLNHSDFMLLHQNYKSFNI